MNSHSQKMSLNIELTPEDVKGDQRSSFISSVAAGLPNLLRWIGAGALIIAMYSFLMKGWHSDDDVQRYWFLLGHTVALALIGMACGRFLKEGKGARLLLGLALVSVPANFAILGGFILSNTPSSAGVFYPAYVAWSMESLSDALWLSAIAIALLLPVMWLGFVVLYRRMGRELAALFLVSNFMLLLPLREPMLVAGSVLFLSLAVLLLSQKISRHSIGAKTQEGRAALALQFLPLAVMAGRSVWLYHANELVFFALAVVSIVAVRQVRVNLVNGPKLRIGLELISFVLAVVGGVATGALLMSLHLSDALSVLVAMLVMGALMYELSMRATWAAVLYRGAALLLVTVSACVNVFVFDSLGATVFLILIGILISVWAYKAQQLALLVVGVGVVVLGLGEQLLGFIQFFNFGGWVSLALMGTSAIVMASVLESRGAQIKPWWLAQKAKLANWN